tara:strand:- start:2209 stop:2610 length:402 start_codon:yes stop_codon:yes gene_type:complete
MPNVFTSFEPSVLVACGLYNIGFAVFHVCFWILFQWPKKLRPSGTINVAITQTLNVVLTYCFIVYGGALIWAGVTSAHVPAFILLAGAGFWLLRASLQPLLFPMRNLPSIAITVVFVAGGLIHSASAAFAIGW